MATHSHYGGRKPDLVLAIAASRVARRGLYRCTRRSVSPVPVLIEAGTGVSERFVGGSRLSLQVPPVARRWHRRSTGLRSCVRAVRRLRRWPRRGACRYRGC